MAVFMACDDGRIYPETATTPGREGYVMKLTGKITGHHTWPDGYSVVTAAFDDESDYALITKNIPTGDGEVSMVMNAIPVGATTVELCVIDRLRQRVATICSIETATVGDTRDTLYLNAGVVDSGMLGTLQSNVFTPRCAGCHGTSNAAGGIHLTDGMTYTSIVSQPSHRISGKNIVEPGNSPESVLEMMLTTNLTDNWGYDHQRSDVADGWKSIITKWIDNGAPE